MRFATTLTAAQAARIAALLPPGNDLIEAFGGLPATPHGIQWMVGAYTYIACAGDTEPRAPVPAVLPESPCGCRLVEQPDPWAGIVPM